MVRESVFKKAPSAGFANDPPVEQLVERVGERGFIPRTHLAHGIAREAIADTGGDLGSGARVFRESLDAARDDCLQRRRLRARLAVAHVDDELRQEKRIATRSGNQRLGGTIAHVGHRDSQFFSVADREPAQPHALRAGRCASLAAQPMKRMQALRFLVAIRHDDHDRHAADAPQ